MRVRPLLWSAACSTAAALALVISEGATSVTHAPLHLVAPPPQARSGDGSADSGQSTNGTFDTGPSPSPDSQTDQQPVDQPPSGGQPQSGSGGIDPNGLAQLLPAPPPIKVCP